MLVTAAAGVEGVGISGDRAGLAGFAELEIAPEYPAAEFCSLVVFLAALDALAVQSWGCKHGASKKD